MNMLNKPIVYNNYKASILVGKLDKGKAIMNSYWDILDR